MSPESSKSVASRAFAVVAPWGWMISTALGCGGSQEAASADDCFTEQWAGACTLHSVVKTRTLERFPKAFIIVEAIYYPKPSPGETTPPGFRKDFLAPADNEEQLFAHIKSYPEAACRTRPPESGTCAPSELDVDVPNYEPVAVARREGLRGCARIEDHSQPTNASQAEPLSVSQVPFDERSAAVSPGARSAVAELVSQLGRSARIECVALTGQIAWGEDTALASARARAVREALLAHGVDKSRVTVFEPGLPAYVHVAAQERQHKPEDRNVKVSIVVYGAAAP